MNKKNILLVSPYSLVNYGGVQNQILLSKKYLKEQSFDLKIFAHGSDDYPNVPPVFIRFNSSISNVSVKSDKLLLRDAIEWADVIHIHEPFIPLVLWKLRTTKPIITTHHAALNIFWSLLLKIIYKIYTRELSITNISVSKLSYKQASSLRPNPIIIPNFIRISDKTSFNAEGSRITFLGRDEKRKGLSIFMNSIDSDIINELKPTVISNTLVDNKHVDSYMKICDEKKANILKQTKIFIAPNIKNESFGIVLLEAISNGAIVIASNIQPFQQVLGDSGIYFNKKNSKKLNVLIKKILNEDMNSIWYKQYLHIHQYESHLVLDQIVDLYNI